MSTQSNAANELPLEARTTAQTFISPGRRLYWSVQRELWENRMVYAVPLIVAALVVLAIIINVVRGPIRGLRMVDLMQQQQGIEIPFGIAAFPLMAVMFLVALFYCLRALHGERSDRSVLFWKSLPVSDLTTVLSKATIPFVILPIVTMALIIITHLAILLILAITLLATGQSTAILWTHLSLPQMWLITLYHLVTIHVLWYAPIYGYLLMISAWAKRAPFLWAVLPPLGVIIVEKIAFGTKYFSDFLGDRLTGNSSGASSSPMLSSLQELTPLHFLSSPGLWLGLVAAVIFLAAAVRLRREQAPV